MIRSLICATLMICGSPSAAAELIRNPVLVSPPGGANDFHMLTARKFIGRCFIIIPCDRKIRSDPWGVQNPDLNQVTGDGILNSWSGDSLAAGNTLTLRGITIQVGGPMQSGNNLLLDWFWTDDGNRIDHRVIMRVGGVDVDFTQAIIDRSVVVLIPEPKTWLLLISGFGLIGVILRRQTRTSLQQG